MVKLATGEKKDQKIDLKEIILADKLSSIHSDEEMDISNNFISDDEGNELPSIILSWPTHSVTCT